MKTYTCSTVGGYDFGHKIAVVCENLQEARRVIKLHLRSWGISDGGELQDCEIKEAQGSESGSVI